MCLDQCSWLSLLPFNAIWIYMHLCSLSSPSPLLLSPPYILNPSNVFLSILFSLIKRNIHSERESEGGGDRSGTYFFQPWIKSINVYITRCKVTRALVLQTCRITARCIDIKWNASFLVDHNSTEVTTQQRINI